MTAICPDCVKAALSSWDLYCAGCDGCAKRMLQVMGESRHRELGVVGTYNNEPTTTKTQGAQA